MFLFSLVLVCLYFGNMYGFYVWTTKQNPKKSSNYLDIGSAIFMLGSFIFGLAASNMIFGRPPLAQYTWIICLAFLIIYCTERFRSILAKIIWIPLVCAIGTYVLHKAFPIPFDWIQAVSLTLVWSIIMAVVIFFDKLPLLNFLTIATWTMAFTAMYVLNSFGSPQISVLGLITLAILWGILNILARYGKGQFGPYTSTLLGFIMGGMIAICLISESYGSALAMLGYYIFEGFFFTLALLGFHPFRMEKGNFVLTKVMENNTPAAIIRIVFYHLLILSLLAVFVWQVNKIGILLILILVVFMDIYNRFKSGGTPAPTIRTLWQDTKSTLKQAWQSWRKKDDNVKKEKIITTKTPHKTKKTTIKKKTLKTKKKK